MSRRVCVKPYKADVLTPLEVKIGRAAKAKCALYTNAMPSSKNSFFAMRIA
jgi:hypothetical protein